MTSKKFYYGIIIDPIFVSLEEILRNIIVLLLLSWFDVHNYISGKATPRESMDLARTKPYYRKYSATL